MAKLQDSKLKTDKSAAKTAGKHKVDDMQTVSGSKATGAKGKDKDLTKQLILTGADIMAIGEESEVLVGGKNYNTAVISQVEGVRIPQFRAVSALAPFGDRAGALALAGAADELLTGLAEVRAGV